MCVRQNALNMLVFYSGNIDDPLVDLPQDAPLGNDLHHLDDFLIRCLQ